MKEIILDLNVDGRRFKAAKQNYSKAKWKQLREFGYTNLTREEVDSQIDAVLAGGSVAAGTLTVIGGFMVDEIILPGKEAKE